MSLEFLLTAFVVVVAPGATIEIAVRGLVFMATTFAVFLVYGLFAARLRDALTERPAIATWMRRAFAASFAAFGARLALAER